MDGGVDIQLVRLLSADGNLLGAAFDLLPLAAVPILLRVLGVDCFDEEVDRVGLHVGDPPAEMIVVADNHAGRAGKRYAGHAVPVDAQVARVPERREKEAQVRIAAKDRFAAARFLAVDGPVVAADALAVREPPCPGEAIDEA